MPSSSHAAATPSKSPNTAEHPTRLPRQLALAYCALIVYASLHPFSGWSSPGLSPFHFLDAGWPRYWTAFDLAFNALAYLPLGFLLTLALHRLLGRWLAPLVAALLGAALSFTLESVQTWLPTRVPSNVDLACNALGAAVGATIAAWHGALYFDRILRIRSKLLTPHPHAELGLVLTGLWLLTQLSPETFLFGVGDMRQLLDLTPTVPYAAHSFFALETGIVVCHTVAIGLIAVALLATRYSTLRVLFVFFLFALSIRTLAAAILVDAQHAFAWLTPGAALGLFIGGVILSLVLFLPAAFRLALAGLALMAGTVLVNIAPPNPYSAVALAAWNQGHFLNFNGLTRLTASVWPFIVLPYLTMLGRRPR